MKAIPYRLGLIAVLLTSCIGVGPALAELPSLSEKDTLGYFVFCKNRDFIFKVTGGAEGKLAPLGKGDKEIGTTLQPTISFVVEELLPDGKTVTKKILPDSLETKDAATAKPGKVSFRGKVTGDAAFEVNLEFERSAVAVGGRLLSPGTLTKYPLRFGVRFTFPESYKNDKKTDRDAKNFAKKLKDDRYSMVWTDGKRVKFNGADKIAADPKIINGPGIADLKIEVAAYQGKCFEFKAAPNSKIVVGTRIEQAFNEGFDLNWYPDPAKDPDAKARLEFGLK